MSLSTSEHLVVAEAAPFSTIEGALTVGLMFRLHPVFLSSSNRNFSSTLYFENGSFFVRLSFEGVYHDFVSCFCLRLNRTATNLVMLITALESCMAGPWEREEGFDPESRMGDVSAFGHGMIISKDADDFTYSLYQFNDFQQLSCVSFTEDESVVVLETFRILRRAFYRYSPVADGVRYYPDDGTPVPCFSFW